MQIYFATATFDDIERDKKIKTEAQLSLIGGTMGLLSGFPIISGIQGRKSSMQWVTQILLRRFRTWEEVIHIDGVMFEARGGGG